MKCYECSTRGGPGGTHYGLRDAIGICRECGRGVCAAHANLDDLGVVHCEAHVEPHAVAEEPWLRAAKSGKER